MNVKKVSQPPRDTLVVECHGVSLNRSSLPTQDVGKINETVWAKSEQVACTVQYTVCDLPDIARQHVFATRTLSPYCTRCRKSFTGKHVYTREGTYHEKCLTCDVSVPCTSPYQVMNAEQTDRSVVSTFSHITSSAPTVYPAIHVASAYFAKRTTSKGCARFATDAPRKSEAITSYHLTRSTIHSVSLAAFVLTQLRVPHWAIRTTDMRKKYSAFPTSLKIVRLGAKAVNYPYFPCPLQSIETASKIVGTQNATTRRVSTGTFDSKVVYRSEELVTRGTIQTTARLTATSSK
jgi:hypothetical protein